MAFAFWRMPEELRLMESMLIKLYWVGICATPIMAGMMGFEIKTNYKGSYNGEEIFGVCFMSLLWPLFLLIIPFWLMIKLNELGQKLPGFFRQSWTELKEYRRIKKIKKNSTVEI
jgi:hypothetical protein